MRKTAEELIEFIKESPDAFHAAAAVVKRLRAAGYESDHSTVVSALG